MTLAAYTRTKDDQINQVMNEETFTFSFTETFTYFTLSADMIDSNDKELILEACFCVTYPPGWSAGLRNWPKTSVRL